MFNKIAIFTTLLAIACLVSLNGCGKNPTSPQTLNTVANNRVQTTPTVILTAIPTATIPTPIPTATGPQYLLYYKVLSNPALDPLMNKTKAAIQYVDYFGYPVNGIFTLVATRAWNNASHPLTTGQSYNAVTASFYGPDLDFTYYCLSIEVHITNLDGSNDQILAFVSKSAEPNNPYATVTLPAGVIPSTIPTIVPTPIPTATAIPTQIPTPTLIPTSVPTPTGPQYLLIYRVHEHGGDTFNIFDQAFISYNDPFGYPHNGLFRIYTYLYLNGYGLLYRDFSYNTTSNPLTTGSSYSGITAICDDNTDMSNVRLVIDVIIKNLDGSGETVIASAQAPSGLSHPQVTVPAGTIP
jgi:hypothetical protein